ncbi:hypothetical protein TNCV_445051 [Trichonephila clavipes]|nr:hypothetical protein TNCV_445051 [Trichonephila clavipes]
MHVKSVEALSPYHWLGKEVRRGECQLRCRPCHLTIVQNDEDIITKKILYIHLQYAFLARCTDVAASFYERVFFNTELSSYNHKDTQHPEYLKQLALETIHKAPCDALQIYTDGSMRVGVVSGSGIFITKKGGMVLGSETGISKRMWVRLGSMHFMAGKVVFLRGLLSPIRAVDLMKHQPVSEKTPRSPPSQSLPSLR